MAEYLLRWEIAANTAPWETDTHTYHRVVELNAEGQKGAPDVFVRIEMREGVPEVVDFRITAKPTGRAVRSADLASWPLEGVAINGIRHFGRAKPTDDPRTWRIGYGPLDEKDHWAMNGQLETARAGRNGPSRAELEEVARVYRDAIDGRPTESVQVMLGYSRRTAARRIQQARAAGLLPLTTQGKKKG